MPIGFMPAFANDGHTIVICSGITGELTKVNIDGTEANHDTEDAFAKCPYAMIGGCTIAPLDNVALPNLYTKARTAKHPNKLFIAPHLSFNQSRAPPHILSI